ncbi:DUF6801 domain-containing protein [Streptomyces sp. NBC_01276]|uniref:DUF6801 domain-containing protein n=1 Tax=Streptomyces sp. NBC_01276 TaxID=2903808 RepID=UPI00352C7B37
MSTGKRTQNPLERRRPVPAVRSTPFSRGPLRTALVAAVAGGVLGLPGAGPAAAAPVSLTLRYTCSTGLIGNLPVRVRIDADVPESAEVGRATPAFPVDAAVLVPADAAKMLGGIGAKTIEGTVEAQARVAAPEGDVRVKVPVGAKAGIPASGSFHIEASGSAPALTFRRAGSARITVGDLVAHLALKDVSGDVVHPGEIDARCTPDAGQNDVLASFRITGGGGGGGGGGGTEGGTAGGTGKDTDPGPDTDTEPEPGPSAASGTAGTAAAAVAGVPSADGTAAGATGSTPRGVLPDTGADPAPWLFGGAGVLLAAGAGALFAVRRSRAEAPRCPCS